MSSVWHSARSSLDDAAALFRASLGKLKAGKAVDVAEAIEQLKMSAESARMVRELVWSELPNASWNNRKELDALIDQIQENLAARAVEQLRFRLLAVASELERGTIVHRRSHRVSELNRLRDQAIGELRSQAGSAGEPQVLPGPEASEWVDWACGLKEPEDAGSLQSLRNGFTKLDDFVANLEQNMWVAGDSPIQEVRPTPQQPAEKVQPERSRLETKVFAATVAPSMPTKIDSEATAPFTRHDRRRIPSSVEEMPSRVLRANTPTPNDATPPPTEENEQKTLAQERALLSGMMGIVSDPVAHFDHAVELPFTGELYRETSARSADPVSEPATSIDQSVENQVAEEVFFKASAASAGVGGEPVSHFHGRVERPSTVERPFDGEVFGETIVAPPGLVSDSDNHFEHLDDAEVFRKPSAALEIFLRIRAELEERWSKQRGILLAVAAVIVLVTLGAMLWGLRPNRTSAAPVAVAAAKPAELSPSTLTDKGPVQPALSAGPGAGTSQAKAPAKEQAQPQEQSIAPKPQDQSAGAKPHDQSAVPKPQDESAGAKTPAKTAAPAKPPSAHDSEVLHPPAAASRDAAAVRNEKDEAPPNVAAEMPGPLPGGPPGGTSNSVASIVRSVPVTVPKAAVEKVRISSGVAQGLLIHQVTPQYPPQARQAHIQGAVVLQVVIGKDGAVQSLHVLGGHPMLNQAAMDAVRKWRYKPYRLNGEPIEADTQINVNFNLSGE